MPRPKSEQPTQAELEVLHTLWERGPLTVRDVMNELNRTRTRAYTSVMSLLNVMVDKGLLTRKPHGRAFLYAAKAGREKTLGRMVDDLLTRAFSGSADLLVSHLLDQARPSEAELAEIRRVLQDYQREHESGAA
jgi:predicted transcriptional regulator